MHIGKPTIFLSAKLRCTFCNISQTFFYNSAVKPSLPSKHWATPFRDGGVHFELGRGRAYKRAPEALTCRGSGDICKIIVSCIFCLKMGKRARVVPVFFISSRDRPCSGVVWSSFVSLENSKFSTKLLKLFPSRNYMEYQQVSLLFSVVAKIAHGMQFIFNFTRGKFNH